MTWISAWAAASEEVGDNNDLGVTILLPTDVTYEMVVSYILDAARSAPVFETIVDRLTKQFGLRSRDAVTAIDRCLGGVFRAMESRPELCPDSTRDPIAWHSFQMATADHSIIDGIESAIRSYGEPE